jgi:hypothetical protein
MVRNVVVVARSDDDDDLEEEEEEGTEDKGTERTKVDRECRPVHAMSTASTKNEA